MFVFIRWTTCLVVVLFSQIIVNGQSQDLPFTQKGLVTLRHELGGVQNYESLDIPEIGVLTAGVSYYNTNSARQGCKQAYVCLLDENLNSIRWSQYLLFPDVGEGVVVASVIKKVMFYSNKSSFFEARAEVIISGEVEISTNMQGVPDLLGCELIGPLKTRPFVAKLRVGRDFCDLLWVSVMKNETFTLQHEFVMDIDCNSAMKNNFIALSSLLVAFGDNPYSYLTLLNPTNGEIISRSEIGRDKKFIISQVQFYAFGWDDPYSNTHLLVGGGWAENSQTYESVIGIIDLDSLAREQVPTYKALVIERPNIAGVNLSDGILTGITLDSLDRYSFQISISYWGELQSSSGQYNENKRGPAISFILDAAIQSSLSGGLLISVYSVADIHNSVGSDYGSELIGKSFFTAKNNTKIHFATHRPSNSGNTGGTILASLGNMYGLHLKTPSGGIEKYFTVPNRFEPIAWNHISMVELTNSLASIDLLSTGYARDNFNPFWYGTLHCANFFVTSQLVDNIEMPTCVFIGVEPIVIWAEIEVSRQDFDILKLEKYRENFAKLTRCREIVLGVCDRCRRENTLKRHEIEPKHGTSKPNSLRPYSLIFPNPAREFVTVMFKDVGEYRLKLMNSSGTLIKEVDFNVNSAKQEERIYLEEIPSGLYFVQIKHEHFVETIKLIVEK